MPCEIAPNLGPSSTPPFLGLHQAQMATRNGSSLCKGTDICIGFYIGEGMRFVHSFYVTVAARVNRIAFGFLRD